MCMKATCQTCNKATWAGCGSHIESVLGKVDKSEWCECEPKYEKDGKEYPPAGKASFW